MFSELFSYEALPVVLWAFIVSQAFGLINIALAVYRYQVKKRDKAINIKIAGNVSKMLNLAFLLNFSLVGLKVVSIAKNVTMKKVTKEGSGISARTSALILLLFCLIKAAIVFVFWLISRVWFEWVILGTALFAMAGKWQKNMHIMRISSLFNTIAIFINSLFFFLNFTSLLKAVFVVASILVFYVMFFIKKGKKAEVGIDGGAVAVDEDNVMVLEDAALEDESIGQGDVLVGYAQDDLI